MRLKCAVKFKRGRRGAHTDRHGALGGVTVGDDFIHGHPKGPNI